MASLLLTLAGDATTSLLFDRDTAPSVAVASAASVWQASLRGGAAATQDADTTQDADIDFIAWRLAPDTFALHPDVQLSTPLPLSALPLLMEVAAACLPTSAVVQVELLTAGACTTAAGVAPAPTAPVFVFAYPLTHHVLARVAWPDSVRHHALASLSTLVQDVAVGDLVNALEAAVPSAPTAAAPLFTTPISREDYEAVISALLPGEHMPRLARLFLSAEFVSVFEFLLGIKGVVLVADIVFALAPLCAGSKSEKLALLWECTAKTPSPRFSRRCVWDYLRSIVLGELALVEGARAAAPADLLRSVNAFALEAMQLLFQIHGAAPSRAAAFGVDAKYLDFQAFGEAYNSTGSAALLWLELLDSSKWPTIVPPPHTRQPRTLRASDTAGVPRAVPAAPLPPPAATHASATTLPDNGAAAALPQELAASDDEEASIVLQLTVTQEDDGEEGELLSLRRADVTRFLQWREAAGFADLHADTFLDAFLARGVRSSAPMTASDLEAALVRCFTPHALHDAQIARMLPLVFTIALAVSSTSTIDNATRGVFVDPFTIAVEPVDAALALMVLCAGSKSEKLSAAFRLLNLEAGVPLPSEAQGGEAAMVLTRRQLWRALRAPLVALMCLSGGTLQAIDAGQLESSAFLRIVAAAEMGGVDAAARFFGAGALATDSAISLQEVSDLYNGSTETSLAVWLELLDPRKWLVLSLTADTLQPSDVEVLPGSGAPPPELPARPALYVFDLPGLPAAFEFTLAMSHGGDAEVGARADASDLPASTFRLPEGACAWLQYVSHVSGLAARSTVDVVASISSVMSSHILSPDDVQAALRVLIPRHTVADADRAPLSYFFMRLVDALAALFVQEGDEVGIPVTALVAALSLLCAGTKSEKLLQAFDLFGFDPEGDFLHLDGLQAYLISIFAVLFTLQEMGAELALLQLPDAAATDEVLDCRTESKRTATILDVARAQAQLLFFALSQERAQSDEGNANGDAISFDDLSQYYNTRGGFMVAPYFELLSIDKWVSTLPLPQAIASVRAAFQAAASSSATLASERPQLPATSRAQPVFSFNLGDAAQPLTFSISLSTSIIVHRLSQTTSLADATPTSLAQRIFDCVHSPALFTRSEFQQFVHSLLADARVSSEEDESWAAGVMNVLFDAFDVDGVDAVPVAEIAAALLLLVSGRKSEKLLLAWALFDVDDDERLSVVDLCMLLRSFLLTLAVLEAIASADTDVSYADFQAQLRHEHELLSHVAMRAALYAADAKVEAGEEEGMALLTYADFAEWYNLSSQGEASSVGSASVPWLELYDLAKWPGLLPAALRGDDAAAAPRAQPDVASRTAQPAPPVSEVEEEAALENGDAQIFVYTVPTVASAAGEAAADAQRKIVLTVADASRMFRLVSALQAMYVTPQNVFAAINRGADDAGCLCHAAFQRAVASAFPVLEGSEALTPQESGPRFARSVLSTIFRACCHAPEEDCASALELTAAVSLVLPLSKSEKLPFVWRLFARAPLPADPHQEVAITAPALTRLLAALLAGLVALSSSAARDVAYDDLFMACATVVTTLYADMSKDMAEPVTFSELSAWYNSSIPAAANRSPDADRDVAATSPRTLLSFLELYEPSKWLVACQPWITLPSSEAGVPPVPRPSARQHVEREDTSAGPVPRDVSLPASEDASTATPVFGFLLTDEGDVLRVTHTDILAFQYFRTASGLDGVSLAALYDGLLAAADEYGYLTLPAFLDVVTALVRMPGEEDAPAQRPELRDADVSNLSDGALVRGVLRHIFVQYDMEASGRVPATELAAGLSAAVPGAKSLKLLTAFRAFRAAAGGDEMNDVEPLPYRTFVQYLRSLLLGVLIFTEVAPGSPSYVVGGRGVAPLAAVAHRRAVTLALDELRASSASSISFQQFAEYYNERGFQVVGVLELLNPAKWQAASEAAAGGAEGDGAQRRNTMEDAASFTMDALGEADALPLASSSGLVSSGTASGAAAVVYTFDNIFAHMGEPYAGRSLNISREDAQHLMQLLKVSGLQSMSLARLKAALTDVGMGDALSKPAFNALIRSLVSGTDLDTASRNFLSFALSSLFFALDWQDTGSVNAADLFAAMSVLCAGPKASKLAACWEVYDTDHDGLLTPHEFQHLLCALLAGLLAMRQPAAVDSQHAQAVVAADDPRLTHVDRDVCNAMATSLASVVLTSAGGAVDALSISAVGEFYNDSPQRGLLHWFELLDLRKWVYPSADGGTAQRAQSRDSSRSTSMPTSAGVKDLAPDALRFDLTVDEEHAAFLVILPSDATNILQVARRSGIDRQPCAAIVDALLASQRARTDDSGSSAELDVGGDASPIGASGRTSPSTALTGVCVSVMEFRNIVRTLARDTPLSNADTAFLTHELMRLFYVLDTDESSTVRAPVLAVALSLLAAGSKSDKLALAFATFDADADGRLTHAELASVFNAVLLALFALRSVQHVTTQGDEETRGLRTLSLHCNRLAADVCDWVDPSTSAAAAAVSFTQFSSWYNAVGHVSCPFLELLSLAKVAAFASMGDSPGLAQPGSNSSAPGATPSAGVHSAPAAVTTVGAAAEVATPAQPTAPADAAPRPVLLFRMHPSALSLQVYAPDAEAYLAVRRQLSVAHLSAQSAAEFVALRLAEDASQADPAALHNSDVLSVFLLTAAADEQKDDVPNSARDVLLRALELLRLSGDGRVRLADAMLVAVILSSGDKSSKLTAAWPLLALGVHADSPPADARSLRALFAPEQLTQGVGTDCVQYLTRVTLSVLCAFSRSLRAVASADVAAGIKACAAAPLHGVADGGGRVLFTAFGQWYNKLGYFAMPWLELLNPNKWALSPPSPPPPAIADERTDASLGVSARDTTMNAGSEVSHSPSTAPLDVVPLSAAGHNDRVRGTEPVFVLSVPQLADGVLRITASDCAFVRAIAEVSALDRRNPSDVYDGVRMLADANGFLTADAYARACDALFSGGVQGDTTALALLDSFRQHVFDVCAFEAGGSAQTQVAAHDVAAALSLLCAGSKSLKMYAAFAAFSGAARAEALTTPAKSGGARLTRAAMRQMLQSVLRGILLYTTGGAYESRAAVHAAADATVGAIWEFVTATAPDSATPVAPASLEFQQFTAWYNARGFEQAPYLELLDWKKWSRAE